MNPDSGILANIFRSDGHLQSLLSRLGWGANVLFTLIFIASLVGLFYNIAKLSHSADSPQQRSQAVIGILVSLICIVALGAFGLIFVVLVGFI